MPVNQMGDGVHFSSCHKGQTQTDDQVTTPDTIATQPIMNEIEGAINNKLGLKVTRQNLATINQN